jgi:uncharacterized membrane protein (DUF485 family)
MDDATRGKARNAKPGSPPAGSNLSDKPNWDRIAGSKKFRDLMATKKVFIVPAVVFFVLYYFALPVLVGYAPQFMSTRVIGVVNLAYLFALSQFIVAWIIAALYVRAADDFDQLSNDIIDSAQNGKGDR